MVTDITIDSLLAVFKRKGYGLPTENVEIFPFGIRAVDMEPNIFNDVIGLVYKEDNGVWTFRQYKGTTDPGTYWLENPANVEGTAILTEGQYINSHKLGLHRGKYKALVQCGPVVVYRDANRDGKLDVSHASLQEGIFGINWHRANALRESTQVDKWSGGCLVIAHPEDFKEFVLLLEEHERRHGNLFTTTLLNERDFIDFGKLPLLSKAGV